MINRPRSNSAVLKRKGIQLRHEVEPNMAISKRVWATPVLESRCRNLYEILWAFSNWFNGAADDKMSYYVDRVW